MYQSQNCPFSCFPSPEFLSVDTGIPVLGPAAWCNYVCEAKYKPFFVHFSYVEVGTPEPVLVLLLADILDEDT